MLKSASETQQYHNPQNSSVVRKKRSALVTLHLWVGLSLGALLALIALSGSTMVFRFELERLLYRSLTHTTSTADVSMDICLAKAQAVNPLKSVRSLRLPINPDGTFEWLTIPIGQTTKEQATTVYMDPHTCAVLGTRGPRKDLMSFLVNFHHALFLGKNGAYLQTCAAAAAIYMALSGLILWWPRTWIWSRLRPRTSARPLHYAVGFWTSWPLLIIATTAIYMAWRSEINKSLLGETSGKISASKTVSDSAKPIGDAAAKPKKPATPVSLDSVIALARSAKPDATWRIITLPVKQKDPLVITYQLPGEYGRTGNNQISLKPNPDGTPRVTAIAELRESSRMKRFLIGLSQIHYGEFGGIATRLLWCATGFMPAILFASGLLMYRRRLRTDEITREALAARGL